MASSYHIDARSYLSAHGVVDKLKQAMADIVRDHPVDPVAALGHAMIAMGSTRNDEIYRRRYFALWGDVFHFCPRVL